MSFPGAAATAIHLEKYSSSSLEIDCGAWTYGRPILNTTKEHRRRLLRIGRYCSIAHGVEIFVGRQGRHATDTLTTYPLSMAVDEALKRSADAITTRRDLFEPSVDAARQDLDVEIGHDVWIGAHSIIMAGVKIGTGAVIGAGAVVTRDVEPYAVVGGVPAKVIRQRHPPEVVKALLESQWWLLEPDEIWRRCGSLIGSRKVLEILALLKGNESDSDSLPATPIQQMPAADDPSPAEKGSSPTLSSALQYIAHDLSNAPAILGSMSAETLTEVFQASREGHDQLPRWPTEDVQKQFTGGYGVELMRRTLRFVNAMAAEGVFNRQDWRGLDFGSGWGRIASVLLMRGRPEQLDLADAVAGSLDLIRAAGFRNRTLLVPGILTDGVLDKAHYDFCYAFSIFTHLNAEATGRGIANLTASLRPDGKFFFTVRHEEYFESLKRRAIAPEGIESKFDGFWHATYPGHEVYGETVVSKDYLLQLCKKYGRVRSLGQIEIYQHLYMMEP